MGDEWLWGSPWLSSLLLWGLPTGWWRSRRHREHPTEHVEERSCGPARPDLPILTPGHPEAKPNIKTTVIHIFYIITTCGFFMLLRCVVCTLCLLMTTLSSPRRPWARLDPPRDESSFLTICWARFLTRQLRDNSTATVAWWYILHVAKWTINQSIKLYLYITFHTGSCSSNCFMVDW